MTLLNSAESRQVRLRGSLITVARQTPEPVAPLRREPTREVSGSSAFRSWSRSLPEIGPEKTAHSMIASAHGNRNLARVRNTDSGTMEPIALNQLERFAMINSGECMGIQRNGQQSR